MYIKMEHEQVSHPQEVAQAVVDTPNVVDAPEKPVLSEVKDEVQYGAYTGQCKWFNDKLGYGFVTICSGDQKGKDIFVHHSGVKPLNSNYKTLRKGEYIQFNIIDGMNGLQAVDVRGIGGGPLMCDFVSTKRPPVPVAPVAPRAPQSGAGTRPQHGSQWQTVAKKSKYGTGERTRPGGRKPKPTQ
jgi:cold shock CspA family protein